MSWASTTHGPPGPRYKLHYPPNPKPIPILNCNPHPNPHPHPHLHPSPSLSLTPTLIPHPLPLTPHPSPPTLTLVLTLAYVQMLTWPICCSASNMATPIHFMLTPMHPPLTIFLLGPCVMNPRAKSLFGPISGYFCPSNKNRLYIHVHAGGGEGRERTSGHTATLPAAAV